MNIHMLKIAPTFFEAVSTGKKTFEIRKDDRGFEVGDVLVLTEYDAEAGTYTGDVIIRPVIYVLRDFEGLAEGYVCMGIG